MGGMIFTHLPWPEILFIENKNLRRSTPAAVTG
jgi:hypothetical protein